MTEIRSPRIRSTRARLAGAALGVVCILASGLVAACDMPPGCSVGIVGDSLTEGTAPHLAAPVAARGCTLAFVSALKSRSTESGVQTVENLGRLGYLPEVLVMALGTNDGPDPAAFAARIDRVMRVMAGRQVIWVNVDRASTERTLDAVLAEADARYDNLAVYDWNAFADAHPQVRARDNIHLTPGGYVLRASLIAQQITPPVPVPEPGPGPAPAPDPVPGS